MSSAKSNSKLQKICGVCGDMTKGYHFGGLCCDSCKAFFRRTVQGKSWEMYLCVIEGHCEISQNRRSCQACRYEKCKKIGMDPCLVMNVEERKALMLRKLERKKQELLRNKTINELQQQSEKKPPERNTPHFSLSKNEYFDASMEWHDEDIDEICKPDDITESCEDEGNDDCLIINSLQRKDQEKIKILQKTLRMALSFPEFPKHYYEDDADVTEHLFFLFCKGIGEFFSLAPEFKDLDAQDQKILLKEGVAKAIFIFGAHQFDKISNCWPRRLLSPLCTFPKITMAAAERFLDDADIFLKLSIFMKKFSVIFQDETVTLLSMMVALFDKSVISTHSKPIKIQETYIQLLTSYLQQQNSPMSVVSCKSEIWKCFSEVQELTERFKRSKSDSRVGNGSSVRNEDALFATSLYNLNDDPKMAPKKALYERIKSQGKSCKSNILIKEHENEDARIISVGNEEHSQEYDIAIKNPLNPFLHVPQDHNYQKTEHLLTSGETLGVLDNENIEFTDGLENTTTSKKRKSLAASRRTNKIFKMVNRSAVDIIPIPPSSKPNQDHCYAGVERCLLISSKYPSSSFVTPISKTERNYVQNLHSFLRDEIQPDSCWGTATHSNCHKPQQRVSVDFIVHQPSGKEASTSGYASKMSIHGSKEYREFPQEMRVYPNEEGRLQINKIQAASSQLPKKYTNALREGIRHEQPYELYRGAGCSERSCHFIHPSPILPRNAKYPCDPAFLDERLRLLVSEKLQMSNIHRDTSHFQNDYDARLENVVENASPPYLSEHLNHRLTCGCREHL